MLLAFLEILKFLDNQLNVVYRECGYFLEWPNAYPRREWGCASPGMGMRLTENGDVPHQEGDATHREWGCASPEMGMRLTGNGDVPHQEWGCDSPGMGR